MSEKQDYTRPVIPLLLCFILGIIFGEYIYFPHYFSLLLVICCFSLMIRAVRGGMPLKFSPLVLFIVLGLLSVQSLDRPDHGSGHISSYTGKGLCRIQGTVVTIPDVNQGRQTFILDVQSVQHGNEDPQDVSGKLRVTFESSDFSLNKGSGIVVEGRIKAFRNFYNPDGFDYEQYMAFQGIWAKTYVKGENLQCLEGNRVALVDRTRNNVAALIDANTDSGQVGSVLKALLIGQRRQVDTSLVEAFSQTGTSHLLAISGLHVGIVAGVAYGVLVWLLSFIPALLWQARVRKYAGLIALIPVFVYGFLAGMAPSTQRAVVMVAVILLTHSLEAEHDIMNSLAWAAMIILALSPGDLFGVSFQLSFSAVFFIIVGMGCVPKYKTEDDLAPGRFKTWFKSYTWVALFAYLGTLPLVLYYFNQLSVIGLPANLVLVPLVGFLVVPLGLFGLFCCPVSSVIAGLFIKLSGLVLGIGLDLVQWLAGLPFSSLKTVRPSVLEVVCYYGLLIFILYAVSKKETVKPGIKKAMAGALALMLVVLSADIGYWVHHRYFHTELRVTVLDVGQGTANLVEFPKGECMMIDGGGFGGISTFDMGEKVVAPFLWSRKIAQVDTVVLSHPESDHLNGLLYILDHFHVKELWYNGRWRSTQSCERLKEILHEKGITARRVDQLQGTLAKGGADIRVLWPPMDHDGVWDEKKECNNTSLVLKISLGGQAFLFPGDIMEKAESRLVETMGPDLESTVLIVPHHGSKTSSTERFIDTVNPAYALISAGYENWFKMPHKIVLRRYRERNIAIYRTDLQGAILMETAGKDLTVKTVHNDVKAVKPNLWKGL